MVLLQPVYGWLVSRFPRRVFLPAVYLVFIACLFGFYLAFHRETPGRGAIFFVWVAVFNLFAVSVFWSFMADIFSDAEARKVYGYIGAGGTLGGLTGPWLTRTLVLDVGVANMMLVSIACLAICLLCIAKLSGWARKAELARGRPHDDAMGGSVIEGLRLVARDPLLRALAVLMFFGVGVGTLLYNQQREIAKLLSEDTIRTQFYSNLDLWINLITLAIQVLLTRRLLTRYGVGPALMIPALRDPGRLRPADGLALAGAGRRRPDRDARGRVRAGQAGPRNDLHARGPRSRATRARRPSTPRSIAAATLLSPGFTRACLSLGGKYAFLGGSRMRLRRRNGSGRGDDLQCLARDPGAGEASTADAE